MMSQVYAEQRENTFVVIVGQVEWVGQGRWTALSLPERKAIVKHLVSLNLQLDCPKVEKG
jgi:hypothetical protein